MWLCGAYVALAPYPLTVVVVVQDSKPKTSSYYTHSSFNLKHRKSWWSSSTGSTMSPTTLSPATPSQVYWKKTKKTEQWFCFWVFVSTRKGLLILFFFVLHFSYVPERVGFSVPRRLLWWNRQGDRWWGKAKGWELFAKRRAFQLIESQTWERGSSWICFFLVLFHSPLLECLSPMPPSLPLQGNLFPFLFSS